MSDDDPRNFLNQISSEHVGSNTKLIDKKMFSIYIADDTSESLSSILFGGSDDEGFLEGTPRVDL